MKRRKREKTNSESGTSVARRHLRYRLREGYLIFTLALSVFLLIALFSYHQSDPSWSHTVAVKSVTNAGGRAGAWLSDFILYMVGYLAYVFPLMISYATWVFFRRRHTDEEESSFKWPFFTFRAIGFCLTLIAGSTIASLYLPSSPKYMPFNSGGILGFVASKAMMPVFNEIGTTLILFALFLIGITLFTGLSWFKLLESIGKAVSKFTPWLFDEIRRLFFTQALAPSSSAGKEGGDARKVLINKIEPALVDDEPIESLSKSKITERISGEFIESEFKTPRYSSSDILPKLSLLDKPTSDHNLDYNEEELKQKSHEVELRLADFGIEAHVVAVHPGPVVTRFELQLAAGTKVSKITNLAKDLARSLSVVSVRVVEVIPGKSVIGLELPNKHRAVVTLYEVLATKQYQNARSSLSLALGKDIAGHPVVVDLAKMPHLLLAGTTGSGKSVSLNAMLLSLLYKSTPRQLRLILIDPKMLELSVYDCIPHLLTPVVTDMKDAAAALRWCVGEMERRYRLMASLGVRHVIGYNLKIQAAKAEGAPLLDPIRAKTDSSDPVELQELPQIVVIADEFADMMVVVGKKVETLIVRLAQKARAAGIHLIFATQRPSVDVITGLIKANIPTRIAFQVSSKVDSRTILDQQGAEQLLGYGDLLYLPPGSGVPVRVHGAYVSDDEVHRVADYLKQNSEPDYIEDVLGEAHAIDVSGYTEAMMSGSEDGERDPLYDQAVEAVVRARRVSVSSIQRRFKIGYNRAARIVEAMEAAGIVSAMETNGSREVLVPATEE